MIAVIARPAECAIVAEFFELFKTPWEFWREGKNYRVIVSTCANVHHRGSGVTILYNQSGQSQGSTATGVETCFISYRGFSLPIYGTVEKLEGDGEPIAFTKSDRMVVGRRKTIKDMTVIRLGYNLFHEVQHLLTVGQPRENSSVPALEYHIEILRDLIVSAGIPVIEIPPVPSGYRYIVCLTHDIDFFRFRDHIFSRTFVGFVYRASFGSVRRFLQGKISLGKVMRNFRALLKVPFVAARLCKDIWEQVPEYMKIEEKWKSTFFLIPQKGNPGVSCGRESCERRASMYGIDEFSDMACEVIKNGFEVGVHGIDAWNNTEAASQELRRLASYMTGAETGIRMHWLYRDEDTFKVLDEAGFTYDSTFGYNDAVGYKPGTVQVFQPLETEKLLELPLTIQDTALFYTDRMDLSDNEALRQCYEIIEIHRMMGGVLTLLWHDRSLAPERLWGDIYIRLLKQVSDDGAWIVPACKGVQWYRKRRAVTFKKEVWRNAMVEVHATLSEGATEWYALPGLYLRVHFLRQCEGDATESRYCRSLITVPLILNGVTHIQLQ